MRAASTDCRTNKIEEGSRTFFRMKHAREAVRLTG